MLLLLIRRILGVAEGNGGELMFMDELVDDGVDVFVDDCDDDDDEKKTLFKRFTFAPY